MKYNSVTSQRVIPECVVRYTIVDSVIVTYLHVGNYPRVEDNVNRVNSTFGISYRVLKLVGSSRSSR